MATVINQRRPGLVTRVWNNLRRETAAQERAAKAAPPEKVEAAKQALVKAEKKAASKAAKRRAPAKKARARK